ncbi:asparagine synthase (glutamine-hydrolyzing) [Pseudomonas sp. N040]|uniref:asparagine synthase (glutamine-hydrolyzing) n=1 Tax=Pseudomonas sp. N040 TaxID=2785325 RepID=UPI0018A30C7D|nr:asparagine synthase (glutamine-hydrolyzing) [Pseudomonas sp. N040]MBF7730500.1 asparagine synthase (glutamine-hydrolyzing) [Pseudomonas sp. N040]MBW7014144.1 asparagine synthase (glutamine-hydrolyzing) [Pseudomonas sp. N040]
MCGVIAFNARTGLQNTDEDAIRLALQSMQARGPDGEGVWQDERMILGHRRLSIIDLDPRAAQPMQSSCGRYLLAFNGEIYNFRELKAVLQDEGVAFRTESDSEVLLALYARHGDDMLPLLRGMFAFVIWDSVSRFGFAARDPYGIKPLYYAQTAEGVWFGSQVKALLATGRIDNSPCPEGQAGFWQLGSVPEPHTWYAAIKALPAGHCVHFGEGALTSAPHAWWRIADDFQAAGLPVVPEAELRVRVREAVLDSVREHMVSDVPVAVFLSGGIDSGALAGMMVELGARELHGITVAFREFAGTNDDEAPVAASIAEKYGIRHHVRWVSREEFQADLPKILQAMDQPTIDGVNTWFASKAVAELGLKVVVSGVGGDELFQGYESFEELPRLVARWRGLLRIPGMLAAGRLLSRLQVWRSGNARWRHAADCLRSMAGAWWLRRSLYAPEDLPALMGKAAAVPALRGVDVALWIAAMCGSLPADNRLALSQIESSTYLRNQLLRDSDWASMAHSVELRTPLVDAHLLRRLSPLLGQFGGYPGKSLLAQCVSPALPDEVTQRGKIGFGVPMDVWLGDIGLTRRGEQSREWAKRVAARFISKGSV